MKARSFPAVSVKDPNNRAVIVSVVFDSDGIREYRLGSHDGRRLRRIDAWEDPDTGTIFRRVWPDVGGGAV